MITILDESLDHPFLEKNSYRLLAVAGTGRWIVFVHPNQSFAGRLYVVHSQLDTAEGMAVEDSYELYSMMFPWMRTTVREMVGNPVRFNTVELGNTWHHLNFHLIPRHNQSRTVAGVKISGESKAELQENYAHSSIYRTIDDMALAERFAREIRARG